MELARIYYEHGADEIVFYSITASYEGRNSCLDIVDRTAFKIFIFFVDGTSSY
ncbi:hypothetical protein DSUL_20094 [Desulfovibrionales bacterium]